MVTKFFKKKTIFSVLGIVVLGGVLFFVVGPGSRLFSESFGKISPNSWIAKASDGEALYKNENPGFEVLFGEPENPGRPSVVYYLREDPKKAISFTLKEVQNPQGEKIIPSFSSPPILNRGWDKSQLSYQEVIPGHDLTYQIIKGKGLKEEIVIKKKSDFNTFVFDLKLFGVEPKLKDGAWRFYVQGTNKEVFYFKKPFMEDKKGAKSERVEIEVIDETVILKADSEWLLDPARVYPVIIDPTVELTILNVHSHPQAGDNWEVSFETTGTADLTITPQDQATIDDLEFASMKCAPSVASAKEGFGQEVKPEIREGDVLFFSNWACDGIGVLTHRVVTAGKHTLKFQFGDQEEFVYNSPYGWVSPTGHSGLWVPPEHAYDNDTGTFCAYLTDPNSWSDWQELTLPEPINCNKIRFWARYHPEFAVSIDLDYYIGGYWYLIYAGSFADDEWVEKSLGGTYLISKARFRIRNYDSNPRPHRLHEFDFWELKTNGESCSGGSECASGHCVDGRCCNSACGGNCNRCNVGGSLGTCTNVNSDCTGNCDVCSGGNCAASAGLCTGNCDQCTGSGTSYDCSANAASCTGDCDVCSGGGTSFDCAADQDVCAVCYDCSGSETEFNCASVGDAEDDTSGTTCNDDCTYCTGGTCTNVPQGYESDTYITAPNECLTVQYMCNDAGAAGNCADPDADSDVCGYGTYSSATYLTNGVAGTSKCCGDDTGEDFEQTEVAGRSCCYNASVLSDASPSGAILCEDGQLYDCNSQVAIDGEVDTEKVTGDQVGTVCCGADNSWSVDNCNTAPTAPDSLLCEGLTNPTEIIDTAPEFSAIGQDPDSGDTLTHYDIEVDDDSGFGSPIWHPGKTDIADFTEGTRCSDISYADSALTRGTTYYWRIKFWDDNDTEGDWSVESASFSIIQPYPSNCIIKEASGGGGPLTIEWIDNSSNETGFEIDKKTDGGSWINLTTTDPNVIFHEDSSVFDDHTYQYRVKAKTASGDSAWCTTSVVDLGTGSFRFEGIQLEGLKIDRVPPELRFTNTDLKFKRGKIV